MVCQRCVESVKAVTKKLDLPASSVTIGSVTFTRKLSEPEERKFAVELSKNGFELIVDRENEIVNRIKVILFQYVEHLESTNSPEKLSSFVTGKLHFNYSYLSQLFSKVENQTVESFLIKLKVERVKELLSYNRYTLSEIAWKLKYSSVQYLSNQFKSITGMTVTEYRKSKTESRQALDQL